MEHVPFPLDYIAVEPKLSAQEKRAWQEENLRLHQQEYERLFGTPASERDWSGWLS